MRSLLCIDVVSATSRSAQSRGEQDAMYIFAVSVRGGSNR